MSILIKGMEMPKDIEPGLVIEFADGIDGKRYARLWHYRHGGLTEWLETVPVPPHGRLIDADALMEIISKVIGINASIDQRNEATDQERRCLWWFEEQVNIAPTIIPAEGGDAE